MAGPWIFLLDVKPRSKACELAGIIEVTARKEVALKTSAATLGHSNANSYYGLPKITTTRHLNADKK